METRASLPPTLPHPNPTVSYWQSLDPSPEIASLRSTSLLPAHADTVIVGSGLTGASIAHHLIARRSSATTNDGRSGPSILMLEARTTTSGATGRNGGHTKAVSYGSFVSNVESLGLEEAIKIATFEYANIKEEHQFMRDQGIEADLYSGDTVDVIYDEDLWEESLRAIELMKETVADEEVSRYEVYNAHEARENFFVDGEGDKLMGAIKYFAGSCSAYKFVLGIIRRCLEKGLNLQTNTPVTSIQRDGDGTWKILTARGEVKAKRLVLATNGYTAYLLPSLLGTIVPLRGQIQAHIPSHSMPQEGLPTTYSFVYEDGYEYMIPRPPGSKYAGDIIMGGGLTHAADDGLLEYGTTDDSSVNPDISRYLANTTPRYFGKNWGNDGTEGRIRQEWTGIMGYTADGFPLVGEVDEGLWICAGFNGHGMVLCFNCARALVEMMVAKEEKVEWVDDRFPEAFRWHEDRLAAAFTGRLHAHAKPGGETDDGIS